MRCSSGDKIYERTDGYVFAMVHLNLSQSIRMDRRTWSPPTPPSLNTFKLITIHSGNASTKNYLHATKLFLLFILYAYLQKKNDFEDVCCSACPFPYSFSITLSTSHHSAEKHLTLPSIKQSRLFMDITFQCSSATLIWTKALGGMKTTHRGKF